MPTLVVGMLEARGKRNMPTASVGMASAHDEFYLNGFQLLSLAEADTLYFFSIIADSLSYWPL